MNKNELIGYLLIVFANPLLLIGFLWPFVTPILWWEWLWFIMAFPCVAIWLSLILIPRHGIKALGRFWLAAGITNFTMCVLVVLSWPGISVMLSAAWHPWFGIIGVVLAAMLGASGVKCFGRYAGR